MNNIQERFEQIQIREPNVYLRAFEDHPLDLYVGFDANNHKSLKYRGNFLPDKIQSTALIEVQQFIGTNYNTVVFSLLDESAESIFIQLCQDLANVTFEIEDQKNGYRVLRDRYNQWRRLFVNASRSLLSEFQIMGLIGELLFLKDYMFPKYGQAMAVQGWSGQDLTHKDFSYHDCWYEIKTMYDSSTSVKISSLEQLDSLTEGSLVIFKMEKMSPESIGIRINNLVRTILDSIDEVDTRDLFLTKIVEQGYAIKNEYDAYVFQMKNSSFYTISELFPRLTRTEVDPAIIKATYEISLPEIERFQINNFK